MTKRVIARWSNSHIESIVRQLLCYNCPAPKLYDFIATDWMHVVFQHVCYCPGAQASSDVVNLGNLVTSPLIWEFPDDYDFANVKVDIYFSCTLETPHGTTKQIWIGYAIIGIWEMNNRNCAFLDLDLVAWQTNFDVKFYMNPNVFPETPGCDDFDCCNCCDCGCLGL